MMRKKSKRERTIPTAEQIRSEILREKYHRKYKQVLKSTMYALIVVAAIAVLIVVGGRVSPSMPITAYLPVL